MNTKEALLRKATDILESLNREVCMLHMDGDCELIDHLLPEEVCVKLREFLIEAKKYQKEEAP